MSKTAHKRGVSIYAAADAAVGSEAEFTQLSEEQLAPLMLAGDAMREGIQSRLLVRDAAGYNVTHLWLKPHFPLPRHNHTPADCLYYVISGSALMGKRPIRAGDSFLVPSGAPYQYTAGPDGIEVLEVRYGVPHIDMNVVEDAEGYRKRATDALEANRDAWAAATVPPTFAVSAT